MTVTTIYSVGLYCPYEGGTPSMYFHKKEDAEFMLSFLERYSVFVDTHMEGDSYDALKSVFDLEKEFKDYFGLTYCTFPWKIQTSSDKFELIEHKVLGLDSVSSQILQKIDNICRGTE